MDRLSLRRALVVVHVLNVVLGAALFAFLERPRRLALFAALAAGLVVPVAAFYGPVVSRYLQIAMPLR